MMLVGAQHVQGGQLLNQSMCAGVAWGTPCDVLPGPAQQDLGFVRKADLLGEEHQSR